LVLDEHTEFFGAAVCRNIRKFEVLFCGNEAIFINFVRVLITGNLLEFKGSDLASIVPRTYGDISILLFFLR
jgi:hypothetical protein